MNTQGHYRSNPRKGRQTQAQEQECRAVCRNKTSFEQD